MRNKKELALRLRKLRDAGNFTQEDLAEVLGIRQPAYSELESGKTILSAERADLLAIFYRISVDALLHGG